MKIVILSRLPGRKVFEKHWGIDTFVKNGIEVLFVDLGFMIDGASKRREAPTGIGIDSCPEIRINSAFELRALLKNSVNQTIYIDAVCGSPYFGIKFLKYARILKKSKVLYYVVESGPIPIRKIEFSKDSIFSLLKKALQNPYEACDFLLSRTTFLLGRLGILFPVALRIFRVGPVEASHRMSVFGLRAPQMHTINSRDFDDFLDFKKESNANPDSNTIGRLKCVFLDEDHTAHPDFELHGMLPLEPAPYLESMNKFFDALEDNFGAEVHIAGHPKSSFSSLQHPYKNRTFSKGNTVAMVADADIAIAHSSTSIGLAVSFSKPVLLISSNQIEQRPDIFEPINNVAKALSASILNIDESSRVVNFQKFLASPERYNYYRVHFLLSEPYSETNRWELVSKFAKNDVVC